MKYSFTTYPDMLLLKILSQCFIQSFYFNKIKLLQKNIEKNIETLLAKNIIEDNIIENKKYVIDVNEQGNYVLNDSSKLN